MAEEKLPRRICIDRMVPAELAICEAMRAVEESGCDVLLTEAVALLGAAKGKVADFVDGSPYDSAIAKSGRVTELCNERNRNHGCRFDPPMISSTSRGSTGFRTITCICGAQCSTSALEEDEA